MAYKITQEHEEFIRTIGNNETLSMKFKVKISEGVRAIAELAYKQCQEKYDVEMLPSSPTESIEVISGNYDKKTMDLKILNKIFNIISEQLGMSKSVIQPHSRFIEDLGADSLDLIELVMTFEEEFNIEISNHEAEKINNAAVAVIYLQEHTHVN